MSHSWKEPKEDRPTLRVFNSLTKSKVPFRPRSGGNSVRWYNCGPTVYDHSHIGHARNYVTFDYIRRIMEDYFSYDVTLVMNITDIDDKIIIRARQAHLFKVFVEENPIITEELLQSLKELLFLFIKKNDLSEKDLCSEDPKRILYYNISKTSGEVLDIVRVGQDSKECLLTMHDVIVKDLDERLSSTITDHRIFNELSSYWEGEFLKDMASLNVRDASIMTRVTEFVPQIVSFVEKIIENGFAYVAPEGSVYFDVNGFKSSTVPICHQYAKLCPRNSCQKGAIEEGEGDLGSKLLGKKDVNDFALWKASKQGEPSWPSPWGPGRPGWHIECSAMAAEVIPGEIDIHSGGIDLQFPHHDNEMAQSEAYYPSEQWVNYFLHAGHVHIQGHKMSKSLKNFITIRQALEMNTARQLRMMFLQHQWDQAVFYHSSSMVQAVAVESLFFNFLLSYRSLKKKLSAAPNPPTCPTTERELEIQELVSVASTQIHNYLCDNFDTPSVIICLQELVGKLNSYLREENVNFYFLSLGAKLLEKNLLLFGLLDNECSSVNGNTMTNSSYDSQMIYLEKLSETRDSLRLLVQSSTTLPNSDRKAIFDLCDGVRNEMFKVGVIFEDDGPSGSSIIKILDPITHAKLLKEEEEKESREIEKKMEKIRIQEEKAMKASISPKELMIQRYGGDEVLKDEDGVPTHLSDGTLLSKSARKKVLKEFSVQKKIYDDAS